MSGIRLAGQQRLPPVVDDPPLLFDERRVLPQRPPDLEVLALDDALRAGNLARHDRIVDRARLRRRAVVLGDQRHHAIALDQVILEADEEA